MLRFLRVIECGLFIHTDISKEIGDKVSQIIGHLAARAPRREKDNSLRHFELLINNISQDLLMRFACTPRILQHKPRRIFPIPGDTLDVFP